MSHFVIFLLQTKHSHWSKGNENLKCPDFLIYSSLSRTNTVVKKVDPLHGGLCRMVVRRSPGPLKEPLKTGNILDTARGVGRFMPRRTPRAQVDTYAAYLPLDLFQLYFSPATMLTLCRNTNMYAAKNQAAGKKYTWADVEVEELYKFFGLLLYTLLVSLPNIQDHWRENTVKSVPFPATEIQRYLGIQRYPGLRFGTSTSVTQRRTK